MTKMKRKGSLSWSRTRRNIDMGQIKVGNYRIDVVKKDIKNLHLAVYPPTGRIRLAAPRQLDDETIRLHIVSKLGWIKKHISRFEQAERLSKRDYVTGESHYLEGRRYILNVITNSSMNRIKIRGKTYIDLYEKPGTPIWHRPAIMREWYRARLKARIEPLIVKWQKIMGVEVSYWAVKKMKTKWGSCNVKAKRIWINLELAKKPDESLEYIIVHELAHIIIRNHGEEFKALMNKYLPDWKYRKERLNKLPLSHEEWGE